MGWGVFGEAWVRWAVWFDTGLRGTPARLTTNGGQRLGGFGQGWLLGVAWVRLWGGLLLGPGRGRRDGGGGGGEGVDGLGD